MRLLARMPVGEIAGVDTRQSISKKEEEMWTLVYFLVSKLSLIII